MTCLCVQDRAWHMVKSQQVGAETMGKRWLYLSLVPAWDSVLPGHGSLSHLQDEDAELSMVAGVP